MKLNKEQREVVYNSLIKEFSSYEIDKKIFDEAIECAEENKEEFHNIKVYVSDYNNINEIVEISFKAKIVIYQLLCKLSEEDIDILITLTEYVEKQMKYYALKRHIPEFPNTLVDEIIEKYQGDKIFNLYIIAYLKAKKDGVEYIPGEKQHKETIVEEETTQLSKKELKKEKKLKKQQILKEKNKKVTIDSSVNTEVVIESEPITEVINKIEIQPIEPQENTNIVSEVEEKIITEITEPEIIPETTKVIENKTVLQPGTAIPTYITNLYRLINMELVTEDQIFKDFISLRYGYLNDSYYTLEEISRILNLSIEIVNNYEIKTIEFIKEYVNNNVKNIELKLKQG